MSRGGAREGAGRKPAPEHLKKVPYNTKLQRWLRDWLTDPAREASGPVLIEEALRKVHKLRPPEGVMLNEMLYVLAANYEDARTFAHQRGHHYTRMVNVDRREKLMGLRNAKLFVVRGAENRKNYDDLMQEAKIRGFEVEYV